MTSLFLNVEYMQKVKLLLLAREVTKNPTGCLKATDRVER